MNTLSPNNFTRNAAKAGLGKRGVGLNAVEALKSLIEYPVEFRPELRSASGYRNISPLIAAGLAKLNREARQYEATEVGIRWLAQLKERNLI